jgi:quinol monooxygenase YgiN
MREEPIVLISRFKPQAGMRTALYNELYEIAQQSHQEFGCQLYIMHQALGDQATILLYVIWENQAALGFHQQTDYFKQFIAKSDAFLAESIDVSLWSKVSR